MLNYVVGTVVQATGLLNYHRRAVLDRLPVTSND